MTNPSVITGSIEFDSDKPHETGAQIANVAFLPTLAAACCIVPPEGRALLWNGVLSGLLGAMCADLGFDEARQVMRGMLAAADSLEAQVTMHEAPAAPGMH